MFKCLTCPYHTLLPKSDETLHEMALKRGYQDEEGKACESARAQVHEEDNQTNYHLNGRRPDHVEEGTTEIYSGYICVL